MHEQQRITPLNAPPLSSESSSPEMLHPPGMAVLVAAVHWLTGSCGYLAVEILGGLLDAVAACILYWTVATYFSARVGFTAAMIYALFPPLAYMSTFGKSPEGLQSVFVIGSLACVLQSTRSQGWKAVAWWIGGGSLVGVCAYLRPDYLLVPVALGAGLWLYTRNFWRSVLAAAALQAAALLILLPWAYRNHQLCGRWIFTSTGLGWTLVGGLGENSNPWGIQYLDKYRYIEAQAQGLSSPGCSEADLYFRQVFWEAVTSKPLGYAGVLVKRLPMIVLAPHNFGYSNPMKTGRLVDDVASQGVSVIAGSPWYVLATYWDRLLMGLVGAATSICTAYMVFRERRRFGLIFLLLSPHLYSIGTHWLLHYEPRYVLPSTFSFLVGAAYVLCQGWKDSVPEQGQANATA